MLEFELDLIGFKVLSDKAKSTSSVSDLYNQCILSQASAWASELVNDRRAHQWRNPVLDGEQIADPVAIGKNYLQIYEGKMFCYSLFD